ncbi:energy transducer TonB [Terracidiphilus sp.]|uniref:energy transducer TonB n=1 Tax=Terracidiphilus sp. TaxID=1964191 RepID=UPI003C144AD5
MLVAFCAASFCVGQQTGVSPLPADPRAILEAARPLYDFSSADLKPWHLRVSYQLYDEKEAPTEQGTFEYWWASPEAHRSSWTRGSVSYTTWEVAGHRHAHQGSSEALSYVESKLEQAFFSPLPSERTVNSDHTQFEKRTYGKDANMMQCVMVGPKMTGVGATPIGLFPTYCFVPSQPALVAYFAYAAPVIEFNQIAKVQGRYLPKQITILSSSRKKLLTASVEMTNGISPQDAALSPPQDVKASYPPRKVEEAGAKDSAANQNLDDDAKAMAALRDGITISPEEAQGLALSRPSPIYPQDAKDARISGTVVIHAVIGRDGWVHDMQVVSAPSASLAASALGAVSQWHYRPYLLNGEPVEVDTTANVIYSLGR